MQVHACLTSAWLLPQLSEFNSFMSLTRIGTKQIQVGKKKKVRGTKCTHRHATFVQANSRISVQQHLHFVLQSNDIQRPVVSRGLAQPSSGTRARFEFSTVKARHGSRSRSLRHWDCCIARHSDRLLQMNSVRDYLLNDHDIDVSNDTDYIGRNLIKLQLYFKELNYEINNEVPKYTVCMLFFFGNSSKL